MEFKEVIERVGDLNNTLTDVDGLSEEYPLDVVVWRDVLGYYNWNVEFNGISLIDSESFCDDEEEDDLEEIIIEELGSVRKYLNTILARFDA